MSRHGHVLKNKDEDENYVCPESGFRYKETDGRLQCLDLGEEESLPDGLSKGDKTYDDFKKS
jgi:UDP-2-acetamido-3-amino-2,3-dideoxy-glucuronate N-acetyltransferase